MGQIAIVFIERDFRAIVQQIVRLCRRLVCFLKGKTGIDGLNPHMILLQSHDVCVVLREQQTRTVGARKFRTDEIALRQRGLVRCGKLCQIRDLPVCIDLFEECLDFLFLLCRHAVRERICRQISCQPYTGADHHIVFLTGFCIPIL